MIVTATEVRKLEELSQRRMITFERRYGPGALDFACHAAFPLTLTTDLSYCLRETFFPDAPWHWAADVLLSGLCNPAGYDLYEMEGATRKVLLHRLLEHFGEPQLWRLDQFMKVYLQHRLIVQPVEQDRLWLLGDRPHWTALACLRPDEAFAAIQQELQQLVATDDVQDRFRLAALIESYADLLSQTNFRPILLDWSERARAGEPIDETATVSIAARQAGFPLEPLEFDVVTLVFDDQAAAVPDDVLRPFEFETVTVNRRGEVVERSPQQAFYFVEPLGEQAPALEMVAIPAGAFEMGSPEAEPERYDAESPQHSVTVPPFFISKYLVTQAQWRAVAALPKVKRTLKAQPSYFKGENRPVEKISWFEAVEFCARLSRHTGREYRLPTEAEWEYACRAGTTTPFYFGETITAELANYDANHTYADAPAGEYRQQTTEVGIFPPNAFGLYDMHGSVWEWCLDHWHDNYEGAPKDGSAWIDETHSEQASHVLRGGSWDSDPWYCRSACPSDYSVDRVNSLGFRVVCVPPRTL
jgi:formylglycine-generating enzyme required for sulfatase activity